MPRHDRRGRWYSTAELNRFLEQLTASGNMAAAAEAIGRDVRGLYLRRRRDPLFAARCQTAIAAFRCGPGAHRASYATGRRALHTAGGEWVLVSGGPQGGPQLRRALKGQLTEAGITLFLRTLAATANLKLSARSVGVTAQAINCRRKRDLAFDQQVTEALKDGVQRLEAALLDSALRGLGGEETTEDNAGAEPEPGWPEPTPLPPMTAAEAFALLRKQQEQLSRPTRWSPDRDRRTRELAVARLERIMDRMRRPATPEAAGRAEQAAEVSAPSSEGPQVRRF